MTVMYIMAIMAMFLIVVSRCKSKEIEIMDLVAMLTISIVWPITLVVWMFTSVEEVEIRA